MAVTRMTTALTVPLEMLEYRSCTQAEQTRGEKEKAHGQITFFSPLWAHLGLIIPDQETHIICFASHFQPFLFVYIEDECSMEGVIDMIRLEWVGMLLITIQ